MEGFKPEGLGKKPDIEEKEGQTTIELDEETINEISSTPKGNEFIRKIKRAVALGSLVLLSTGVFAQEKPQQDKVGQDIENVDMKALKKELTKIGKEHKDVVISKIFNISGENDPAYLIQEEGVYKLVVPGTSIPGRQDVAKKIAIANAKGLLGGGLQRGFATESSNLKANKKDGTITWFVTIPIDDVTIDGKPAIDKLLK